MQILSRYAITARTCFVPQEIGKCVPRRGEMEVPSSLCSTLAAGTDAPWSLSLHWQPQLPEKTANAGLPHPLTVCVCALHAVLKINTVVVG